MGWEGFINGTNLPLISHRFLAPEVEFLALILHKRFLDLTKVELNFFDHLRFKIEFSLKESLR